MEEKNSGITLIALVITIVVLLILAGISLSLVFDSDALFKKASSSAGKYNEAKARETLEIVLMGDASMQKYTNPKYNQDDFLDNLIKKEVEGADVKGDVVIVDVYAFELDRSVPRIGKYLGNPKDLVWPTITVSKPLLADNWKTASFTVTAIEEKNGISKIEVWLNGQRIDAFTKEYSNTTTEIKETFTVNKNGVYTVKAYSKLLENAITEVTGIVPAVEFSPNGDATWKKEHLTKITVKETGEIVTGIKYLWTDSGTNEPKAEQFTETCTDNSIVIGKDFTGIYFLWVLLETNTGKKNICGSGAFKFDNTNPTLSDITTEWTEEEGNNRLKISISNIVDTDSGINENLVKLYIIPQSGKKIEKKINVINGEANAIIDGLIMESVTNLSILVNDNAGNEIEKQKRVGQISIIKDGKLKITETECVGPSSSIEQKEDGVYFYTDNGGSRYSSACGIWIPWVGGEGKAFVEWDSRRPSLNDWDWESHYLCVRTQSPVALYENYRCGEYVASNDVYLYADSGTNTLNFSTDSSVKRLWIGYDMNWQTIPARMQIRVNNMSIIL